MLASSSEAVVLVVQTEPIPSLSKQPLPTEYWTRPINDQFQSWQNIGGNWLPASNNAGTYNRIAWGNDFAPQAPHILWSRPITAGGLIGGAESSITENITNDRVTIGDAYQGKFLRQPHHVRKPLLRRISKHLKDTPNHCNESTHRSNLVVKNLAQQP